MKKTLYKLNNDKIREWKIEVVEDKKKIFLKTTTGLQDGKKTIFMKEVERPKSKKTILEQAEAEALSKINKKRKELYYDKIPDSKESIVKKSLDFRPMLADKFDPKKNIKFVNDNRYIVQVKLDGMRFLAKYKNGKVIMLSRNGIEFYEPVVKHILDIFEGFYKKTKKYNIIFDGEIYIHGDLSFQKSQSLLRLKKGPIPKEKMDEIQKLEAHIFDIIDIDDLDMSYENRYKLLDSFESFFKGTKVKIVPVIHTKDFDDIHDKLIKEGYEGIMIKNKDAPYMFDKRSKHILKYKKFQDDEFKIVGFTKENKKDKELVIWICETKDGKEFKVEPIASDEERIKLYKDAKKYVGKLLTVKYFGLTDGGIPRFPKGVGIRYDL